MTHQYPKYVFHEEFGNGELINGMHDQPAEDGSVSWFDVMFEHGIEQKVSIDDLYLDEAGMPSSVIKSKQQISNDSDERNKARFAGKSLGDIRSMAWRHGHGKGSKVYDKFHDGITEEVELDEDAPKGRGRPPKPGSEAAKRQAEAGGQSEEAVGLEAQLLKHKDLYGQKTGPIKFADGSTHDISSGHREKALQKIRELRGAGTNPDTRDKTTASMHSSHDKFLQHIGAKPTPKKEYHPMAINKEEVQGITRLKNGTFLAVNESGEAMTFKSQSLAIQFVGEMKLSPKQKDLAAAGKKINPKNNPDEIDAEDLRAVRKEEAEGLDEISQKLATDAFVKRAKQGDDNDGYDDPYGTSPAAKANVKAAKTRHLIGKKFGNAASNDAAKAYLNKEEVEDLDEISLERARATVAKRTNQRTIASNLETMAKSNGLPTDRFKKVKDMAGRKAMQNQEYVAKKEMKEEADQKDSVYVESNRFRGVENSIRSVMENNTNLRKLAEVAKWKKNNPE